MVEIDFFLWNLEAFTSKIEIENLNLKDTTPFHGFRFGDF